jgi:DNA-binding NarL/FixJ family response regulator
VRQTAVAFPLARVVVLTREEEADPVEAVLGAGASAYISKCVSGAELVASLRDVMRGNRVVSPSLSARGAVLPVPTDRIDTLTDRERQVLESVGRGNTNKEVARELNLSEKTVKQHMSRIMDKLQVRNRVEAVIVARGSKPAASSE